MSILSAMMNGILAVVSQRAFWTEKQLSEFVKKKREQLLQVWYDKTVFPPATKPPSELRAMRIFATETQHTWLFADDLTAYCVLDDRKWEEPRIQWQRRLTDVVPVMVNGNWSDEVGVIQFGKMAKEWLYSKELFADNSAAQVIGRFLEANHG